MKKRHVVVVGVALLLAALAAGGVAIAGGELAPSISGKEAGRAIAAALEATGGGRAIGVEREGEAGAAWEVEVAAPDGTTVEVRLDEDYRPVGIDSDEERVEDADDATEGPDDD